MEERFRKTAFSKLRVGRVRLNLAEGVCSDWARNLIQSVIEKKPRNLIRYPPPPGWTSEVALKVYERRPKHNLWRLLRASRTGLEAAGYMAFTQHGLAVPRLLLWGEARRWGLFEFGIVVTLWIDAPSISEAYALTRQDQLLLATAEALALIHKAGLAHGDSYARNFLATPPLPTTLDLASWGRFGKASQLKDLTRFSCSIIKLTGNLNQAKTVLLHYERSGLLLPVTVDDVVNRAVAYMKARSTRP